jgi:hypothetical protein
MRRLEELCLKDYSLYLVPAFCPQFGTFYGHSWVAIVARWLTNFIINDRHEESQRKTPQVLQNSEPDFFP